MKTKKTTQYIVYWKEFDYQDPCGRNEYNILSNTFSDKNSAIEFFNTKRRSVKFVTFEAVKLVKVVREPLLVHPTD